MVASLNQANRQVELLTQSTLGDPMVKCIETFELLPLARQEEALRRCGTWGAGRGGWMDGRWRGGRAWATGAAAAKRIGAAPRPSI